MEKIKPSVISISENFPGNSGQKQILTETIFEIGQDPNLVKALELAYPLTKNGEITLKAKGEFIPNAITVANILTKRILKDRCKVHKVTVDSEPIVSMGSFNSVIEIILKSPVS